MTACDNGNPRRTFGGSLSPIELVRRRLDGVRGAINKFRATCPTCRRRGALSVSEGRDRQALLRCFAGCELRSITGAIGLGLEDLFASDSSRQERERERIRTRRTFAQAPRQTVREALDNERDELRKRLRAELGFDRPLRSSDINEIRGRVCRIFGLDPVTLPPVAPFAWECPPHDDDPAWPTLFMRALEEETRRRAMTLFPAAAPWEIEPAEAELYDRIRAERLAREWQRSLAS